VAPYWYGEPLRVRAQSAAVLARAAETNADAFDVEGPTAATANIVAARASTTERVVSRRTGARRVADMRSFGTACEE
jgi:hypothetical protein